MRIADRIESIATLLPDDGAITIPIRDLRNWIAEDVSHALPAAVAAREAENWLTADECGERLRVSPRWCYDHKKELGGKKMSRRCVRFSEEAVMRYMTRAS
jgi:hypothetical protein